MEKAKLELTKAKDGRFAVNVVFVNGKRQKNSDLKLIKDNSLDGKEVEILREKGQILKMFYEGKEFYKKNQTNFNPGPRQNQRQNFRNSPYENNSMAPYNFVPLNKEVVPAEKIPEFDKYDTDNKFTGYIDIEIKTLTPLYIRNTLTEEEYKEKLEKEKRQEETYINTNFFSPGDLPRIPGSSLRGMIRTLVEIVSFGKFGFFEKDRKYHFRSFADKSFDLREQYVNQMLGGNLNKGYFQKVKAGYLIKKGLDFFIIPAKILSDTQFFRVEEKDAIKSKVIAEPMKLLDHYCCPNNKHREKYAEHGTCVKCGKNLIEIYKPNPKYKVDFKYVKFKFEAPKKHNHSKPLYYAKVKAIWDRNDNNAPSDALEGALVLSNWMRGPKGKEGKHLHWVIGPEDNQTRLPIPQNVIEDYKNDKNRDDKINLLKCFKDNPDIKVPCFYIEKNDKVISFGHTGLFRLAYSKSLMNFLYDDLLNTKIIDISEAIFGTIGEDKENKTVIASRVFFEDAYLINGELMQTVTPKILSNPKPTTFQHYLEQDERNITITHDDKGDIKHVKGLKTYNDSTLLRGYKLYWHRSGLNYEAEEISYDEKDFNKLLSDFKKSKDDFKGYIIEEKNNKIKINLMNLPQELKAIIIKSIGKYETQHTLLKPINKGATFHGRIRFENLSEVELGALLFALHLPEGLAHKIGMGKPLGLGSVKITPKLYLSNRKQRYTDLFAEWDGLKDETNKITGLKNTFERYVLDKLQDSGKLQKTTTSLWEIDRMQQLKTMLDWNNKPKDEKTDYLPLNEFRKRKVLPPPTEV